jgi:hypothetical protein
MRVDIPGIGGSLGECCVCGETFLQEILLGKQVAMIGIEGLSRDVPVHQDCVKTLQSVKDAGGNWRLLPEGPLRAEFAKAHKAVRP